MNLKRFTARTSRDALALVRQAFGDDAVVMSTRPCAEGVEVLAMAPESLQQLERVATTAPQVRAPQAAAAPAPTLAARVAQRSAERAERIEPRLDASPAEDAETLAMSTLSFQDYVRERMLKRRAAEAAPERAASAPPAPPDGPPAGRRADRGRARPPRRRAARAGPRDAAAARGPARRRAAPADATAAAAPALAMPAAAAAALAAARGEQVEMLEELRSMRGLIEQRFGALAFMEKLQREPRQAQLAQRLLATGFSPALIRKLVAGLPSDTEEMAWAAGVLERNLVTGEREPALEDAGGVFALIGATGVGKTTSTAKLAAAFATKHGAANLGLITLDAYRVAAHEQLRAYGRILGVPVHTAHDRASLEDLLDLLSGKRMVLIDTAGMAQRDTRTRELLDMLSHRAIQRLLVLNASAQGETIEDQIAAYAAGGCRGVVLSKLDEAVKLGPALDAMIRHRLKVLAVANGQRVPEDWHRLSGGALVQRALKGGGTAAWKHDDHDVSLIFAGSPVVAGGALAAAL
ncbi:MAG: flagellar biosynthesis protein FlhF [Rubrivivax sp.]|nr:flagellar biosynthesis protein FlhF [Rubrivivax sp.]